MPSASYDRRKNQWIASFLGLGKKRGDKPTRVRIPRDRVISKTRSEKDVATAYAEDCEKYCRLIEKDPKPEYIRTAAHLKAIDEETERRLYGEEPAPVVEPEKVEDRITIIAAAEMHPTVQGERRRDWKGAYSRHMKGLEDFITCTGIEYLDDLKLEHAQKYIEDMRAGGLKYPTRVHRIMYLKCAATVAGSLDRPNPLGRFKLDREEAKKRPAAFTLDQLCIAAGAIEKMDDDRALAALGLGGFMGLRPSEITRIKIRDIDGDLLHVGAEVAKNEFSRRTLAMPSIVLEWVKRLAGSRAEDECLFRTHHRSGDMDFSHEDFSHWLGPIIRAAIRGSTKIQKRIRKPTPEGPTPPPPKYRTLAPAQLGAKHLRKSFITWALNEELFPYYIEFYSGHALGSVSRVTTDHYLATPPLKKLRAFAEKLDALIRSHLHSPATPVAKR